MTDVRCRRCFCGSWPSVVSAGVLYICCDHADIASACVLLLSRLDSEEEMVWDRVPVVALDDGKDCGGMGGALRDGMVIAAAAAAATVNTSRRTAAAALMPTERKMICCCL